MESRESLWVFIDSRSSVMRSFNIFEIPLLFVRLFRNWKLMIVFLDFTRRSFFFFYICERYIIILIFDSDAR